MDPARALLLSALACLALLALPGASAAAPVEGDARCTSTLHTVQVVCFQETPREYVSCYQTTHPRLWANCL